MTAKLTGDASNALTLPKKPSLLTCKESTGLTLPRRQKNESKKSNKQNKMKNNNEGGRNSKNSGLGRGGCI